MTIRSMKAMVLLALLSAAVASNVLAQDLAGDLTAAVSPSMNVDVANDASTRNTFRILALDGMNLAEAAKEAKQYRITRSLITQLGLNATNDKATPSVSLGYSDAVNPNHPWQIVGAVNRAIKNKRQEDVTGGAAQMKWGLWSKQTFSVAGEACKKEGQPSPIECEWTALRATEATIVGTAGYTENQGIGASILLAAGKTVDLPRTGVTDNLQLIVNAGWQTSHPDGHKKHDDDAPLLAFAATYVIGGTPVNLNAAYTVNNDVDDDSKWSASLGYDLTPASWSKEKKGTLSITAGYQKKDTFTFQLRWIPKLTREEVS